MKELVIEWKHLDVDGQTCDRCADTGEGIREVVRQLQEECAAHNITISLKETRLTGSEVQESNRIFINGASLENVISGAVVSKSSCPSCSDLIGASTCCRTIIHAGREHETIPPEMIRDAVCKVAGCCQKPV